MSAAFKFPAIPTEMVPLYPFTPSLLDLEKPEDYIPPAALLDPLGYGDRAWKVCSLMPVPTAPHLRFGDVAAPWFAAMVKAVYGTVYNDGTGPRRQIKRVLLLAGKKTGKSTSAAALTLTHQIVDNAPNGQSLLLAPTRDATRHVFSPMSAMASIDPILRRRFKPVQFSGRIKDVSNDSMIRVAAFEMASVTGSAANLLIVDEAHLMVKQTAAAIIGQAERGQITHREPLEWIITTMPVDKLQGPLYDRITAAWQMFRGEADDRETLFLPFSLPDGVDLEDTKQWWRANPNIGRTVELATLKREWDKAKGIPAERSFFISQIFNKDPSAEAGAARWMALRMWDGVADSVSLETLMDESDCVWVGVDAGGLDDCSAITVLGLSTDEFGTDHWKTWTHQWLARDAYEEKKDTAPYDDFIAAGDLTIFEDAMDDVGDIVDLICRIDDAEKLCAVGVDSYQLREVQTRLLEKIEGDDVVVAVPQGWKLQPAILWLERLIKAKTVRHSGSPMMRWNVGNAVVEKRGNAKTISKASLGSGKKIDGLAALLTCAAVASQKVNQSRASSNAGVAVL